MEKFIWCVIFTNTSDTPVMSLREAPQGDEAIFNSMNYHMCGYTLLKIASSSRRQYRPLYKHTYRDFLAMT